MLGDKVYRNKNTCFTWRRW